MKIVFFAHPHFLGIKSLNRYVRILSKGMQERGHQVEVWAPVGKMAPVSFPGFWKKWLGYIELYILFPYQVRKRISDCPRDTLFVFTDHALGPWVPLIKDRPHIIHCHDFLAQRSAFNKVPENKTSFSGRQYQKYIRRGYTKGKNFISISQKTQEELGSFLKRAPILNEVIYNSLPQTFKLKDPGKARALLYNHTGLMVQDGYVLHIGGNQWYKNRPGVIALYNAWRSISNLKLPLLLIGQVPNSNLQEVLSLSPYRKDIYVLCDVEDSLLQVAYSGAVVFLFPSLAEGFGWPIIEAMASGCPVITTGEAPMTEVGGDAAIYISRQPCQNDEVKGWAEAAAKEIDKIVSCTPAERNKIIDLGLKNVNRFERNGVLDKVEVAYRKVLQFSAV